MNDSSSTRSPKQESRMVIADTNVDATQQLAFRLLDVVDAATKRRDRMEMELCAALKAKSSCLSFRRISRSISFLEKSVRSAEKDLSDAMKLLCKALDKIPEGGKDDSSSLQTPLEGIARTLSSTSPSATNPWKSKIKAPTPRPQGLREKTARHYDCYQPAPNGSILAKCFVTGIEGDRKKVTNAHLLPRNAPKHFLKELHMTSVDDRKNMIMLCYNIDKAFENEKLCFIREDDENLSSFKMKIWDSKVRDQPVFDGARKKIRDFESLPFSFPEGKVPYTRVLLLHAKCSYQTAIDHQWIDPKDEPEPKFISTPFDNTSFSFRSFAQHGSSMVTEVSNTSNDWTSPRPSDLSEINGAA